MTKNRASTFAPAACFPSSPVRAGIPCLPKPINGKREALALQPPDLPRVAAWLISPLGRGLACRTNRPWQAGPSGSEAAYRSEESACPTISEAFSSWRIDDKRRTLAKRTARANHRGAFVRRLVSRGEMEWGPRAPLGEIVPFWADTAAART